MPASHTATKTNKNRRLPLGGKLLDVKDDRWLGEGGEGLRCLFPRKERGQFYAIDVDGRLRHYSRSLKAVAWARRRCSPVEALDFQRDEPLLDLALQDQVDDAAWASMVSYYKGLAAHAEFMILDGLRAKRVVKAESGRWGGIKGWFPHRAPEAPETECSWYAWRRTDMAALPVDRFERWSLAQEQAAQRGCLARDEYDYASGWINFEALKLALAIGAPAEPGAFDVETSEAVVDLGRGDAVKFVQTPLDLMDIEVIRGGQLVARHADLVSVPMTHETREGASRRYCQLAGRAYELWLANRREWRETPIAS